MTKAGPGTNIRALHSGDVRMCCPPDATTQTTRRRNVQQERHASMMRCALFIQSPEYSHYLHHASILRITSTWIDFVVH